MAYLKTTHFVMEIDGKWLYHVRGKDNREYFVICNKDLVLVDEYDDWIPVAICAKDDLQKIAMVEFPEGHTEAVNRLWVSLDDLILHDSHANCFADTVEFPILRVDLKPKLTAWDERVRVVKIETTAEAAQLECDRLNKLKGGEKYIYFWQPARKP